MSYSGHKQRQNNDMKIKGKDSEGNEVDVKVSPAGDMYVSVEKFQRHGDTNDALIDSQQSESIRIGCVTDGGKHLHLKATNNGCLKSHEVVIRQNGYEKVTIHPNSTGYSSAIPMIDNKDLALYGSMTTTAALSGVGREIYIEYSNNGVDWFRGAEGSNKVLLVTHVDDRGEFYEQNQVLVAYARIKRKNTTSFDETIELNWTRA